MQPMSYITDVQQPFQSSLNGINAGIGIANAMDQQSARNLVLQQQQAQMARTKQMQMDLAALSQKPNPTVNDYVNASSQYPELAEHFKNSWGMLNEAQQQSNLSNASQVFAALNANQPDIAKKILDDQATALTNAGRPEDAQHSKVLSQLIDQSPETAKSSAGLMLSSVMGKDKFAATFADIGKEQRANDMQPTEKALKESEIAANNAKANPFGIGAPGQAAANGLHGDDFLSTLPSGLSAQVKALAEGRQAFPSGAAMRNPATMQLLSAVGQYDPTFDAVNYNARSKTRVSFVAGPDATNITALNTAIGHLDSLGQAFDKLGNSSMPTYNTAANWIGEKTGDAKTQANVTAVKVRANAVANEMAKVFRSTGMSEQEIKDWKTGVDISAPPATQKAYIDSALELMRSRLDALGEKYNQGMGTTKKGIELLSPKAQEIFQKLSGISSDSTGQTVQPSSGGQGYRKYSNGVAQ